MDFSVLEILNLMTLSLRRHDERMRKGEEREGDTWGIWY